MGRSSSDKKMETLKLSLDDSQRANRRERGKFKYVPATSLGLLNGTYEDHEYVGPLGAGYIRIQRVKVLFTRYIKITDYGPNGYSHDWRKIEKGMPK